MQTMMAVCGGEGSLYIPIAEESMANDSTTEFE